MWIASVATTGNHKAEYGSALTTTSGVPNQGVVGGPQTSAFVEVEIEDQNRREIPQIAGLIPPYAEMRPELDQNEPSQIG